MAAMACEQEGTSGAAPASEGHSHHSGNKARSVQVLKLLVKKNLNYNVIGGLISFV